MLYPPWNDGYGGKRGGRWGNQDSWQLEWLDNETFKLELEEKFITDEKMQEWCSWMDRQLQMVFPDGRRRQLVASKLSFARNEIADEGVRTLVNYLVRKGISVLQLKLYRNCIGDVGAASLGELVSASPLTVQEVHLSYNFISDRGAVELLQAISRSGRYPCLSQRSENHGRELPLWMRLEYNYINWPRIQKQLDEVKWMSAEARDSQAVKDSKAAICLHYSYRNQQDMGYSYGGWWDKGKGKGWEAEQWQERDRERDRDRDRDRDRKRNHKAQGDRHERGDRDRGEPAWANSQGDAPSLEEISKASFAHKATMDAAGPLQEEEANPEDIPLYVFMDWSAVQHFIDRKDELFSFRGLLNLCEQRLMCCVPPDSDVIVQDRDRIVFVVLNLVMDELLARANTPGERQKIEQLKTDENSPLQRCTRWGVVDVILDAPPPTELKKLPAHSEQVASELGISFRMVHLLDFAFLWDSNIEVPGRTLFVVAEEAMYQFSRKACLGQRGISVVHLRELEERFAQDTRHGGGQLTLAAAKAGYCRAVLDANVLSAIAGELTRQDGGSRDYRETGSFAMPAQQLKAELQEALSLLGAAKQMLAPRGVNRDVEVTACLDSIHIAERRWSQMLSR